MSRATRFGLIQRLGVLAAGAALAAAATVTTTVGAEADSSSPAPPPPVFTPIPTNWGPNIARSHARQITDADLAAEREMCEWFNAQFGTLMDQINAFNANLAPNHGGDAFKIVTALRRHFSDGFKNHNRSAINEISIGLTNWQADKIRNDGVCA
jgi:hypothetical protein